jgi:hypothetical protein
MRLVTRIDIVITGVPGAGKTTLARELSKEFELPLLSLDRVKEAVHAELRDVVGVKLRRVAGAVLWDLLADASRGAVVDIWLEPRRDGGVLAAGLIRAAVPIPVEVLCRVPPAVAVRRYADRVRGGPHLPPDLATLARIRRAASTMALHGLGPGCEVDSTTPVDIGQLARWIRSVL